MTPEQVSALSDKELNRAMYDHYWVVKSGEPFDEFFNSIVGSDKINYLKDYNLTMPLAKKHMLTVRYYHNCTDVDDFMFGFETTDKDNPLRAICECLVLIGLESK